MPARRSSWLQAGGRPAWGSHVFARDLASRNSARRGADPLSFLSSLFGNKFASVQTRGLGGERVYKHPGQFFRNTSYNSVTQLCLSFNFSQLVQNVQILLSQIRTKQIPGSTRIENKTTSASREGGELPRATKLSLATHWSEAMQWPPTMHSPQSMLLPQSVLLRPVVRSALEVLVRLPSPQAKKPGEAKTRAVDRLFTLTKLERWDTERTQIRKRNASKVQAMISSVPGQALAKTTYVGYVGDKSLLRHISLDTHSPKPVPRVTVERWLRTAARQRRSSDPSVPFAQQRSATEVRFAFEKRSDLLRFKQMNAGPRSLDAGFAFIPQSMLRTLTKRSTWLTDRSQFETKLFKQSAIGAVTAEVSRNLQSASELILVRKEGAVRVPPLGFVFAQLPRQSIAEERAEKKVEPREIVELVKKEVRQTMARESPLASLTSEDYAEISDRVYSSLARRLTVERERLGLR